MHGLPSRAAETNLLIISKYVSINPIYIDIIVWATERYIAAYIRVVGVKSCCLYGMLLSEYR